MRFVDTSAPVIQCSPQQVVLDATCKGRIPTIVYSAIDCDSKLTTVQSPSNLTNITGVSIKIITINTTDSARNRGTRGTTKNKIYRNLFDKCYFYRQNITLCSMSCNKSSIYITYELSR